MDKSIEISNEIFNIKFDDDLIDRINKIFFDLMKKYNIKSSKECDDKKSNMLLNPEWLLFQSLFQDILLTKLRIHNLCNSGERR